MVRLKDAKLFMHEHEVFIVFDLFLRVPALTTPLLPVVIVDITKRLVIHRTHGHVVPIDYTIGLFDTLVTGNGLCL